MAKTKTSFKPGEVHNPNGRPKKGYSITETVRAMLTERPEIKQALATKIMDAALKGDVTAQKLLWNYMDGMPEQKTELSVAEKPTPILPLTDSKQELEAGVSENPDFIQNQESPIDVSNDDRSEEDTELKQKN